MQKLNHSSEDKQVKWKHIQILWRRRRKKRVLFTVRFGAGVRSADRIFLPHLFFFSPSSSKCVNILKRQERDRLRQVEKWFLQLPELIISFFDSTIGIRFGVWVQCTMHWGLGNFLSFFQVCGAFLKAKESRKKLNETWFTSTTPVKWSQLKCIYTLKCASMRSVCSKHSLSLSRLWVRRRSHKVIAKLFIFLFSPDLCFSVERACATFFIHGRTQSTFNEKPRISYFCDGAVVAARHPIICRLSTVGSNGSNIIVQIAPKIWFQWKSMRRADCTKALTFSVKCSELWNAKLIYCVCRTERQKKRFALADV